MWHPQSSTTCRAKPGRAKRGSAVTRPSEARCLGRAKRGVTPSLARAAKQARMRFNCRDSTAASKRPWSAGKRALHERDTFSLGVLLAGSFRAPKPLRVQCQTCLMNCSRARSTCFVNRNRIRARRRSSIGSSKTPLPESPKRRKDLFCRLKWDRFPWASSVLLMGIPKACSPRHYERSGLSAKSSQTLRIQWFERQELPGTTLTMV